MERGGRSKGGGTRERGVVFWGGNKKMGEEGGASREIEILNICFNEISSGSILNSKKRNVSQFNKFFD